VKQGFSLSIRIGGETLSQQTGKMNNPDRQIMLPGAGLPLHETAGTGGGHQVWLAWQGRVKAAFENLLAELGITDVKQTALAAAMRAILWFDSLQICHLVKELPGKSSS
jgi:hypothetical protein